MKLRLDTLVALFFLILNFFQGIFSKILEKWNRFIQKQPWKTCLELMCSAKCFSAPLVKTMEKYQQKEFMLNKYCQIRKIYDFIVSRFLSTYAEQLFCRMSQFHLFTIHIRQMAFQFYGTPLRLLLLIWGSNVQSQH